MGSHVSIKLADGTNMTVGENSTENKLYTFLNDESIKVSEDKDKDWITMDRVYFETGKAVLTAESQNQLKNISAILNNYPSTQIKMGGYTDQTGPTEVNVKVSGERANSAMASLVALGVDGSRVAAEGYGPEHPVCTTDDSPECLAQNRRVDIRVKSK